MAEDKQDKLAKQPHESSEFSQALSELPPLEQVLVRAQIRWPYPEMGPLERQDWREVLGNYPVEEVIAALNRLMEKPPKMTLGDGSVEPYTGRPTVVNVTQTINQLRQERAEQCRQRAAEIERYNQRELQRRRDAGEKFYGMADLEAEAKRLLAAKTTPPAEDQQAKLERQKKELLK